MKKVIKFTNFSNEEFIGKWDGTPWNVKAGETIMLQEYLAIHFAKHLIDRELNKKDESTSNQIERAKMLKMCLGAVVAEVESDEKAETEVLNDEPEENEPEQENKSLKYLSRKELDKIAEEKGVKGLKNLETKQEVIDAINDEGEKDEDKNEEDEFEGDK